MSKLEKQDEKNEKVALELADEIAWEKEKPVEGPSQELKEARAILKARKRAHRKTLEEGRLRVIKSYSFL